MLILAFPGHQQGSVEVLQKTLIKENLNQTALLRSGISTKLAGTPIRRTYNCHQNPIDLIYLSNNGRLLATASTNGTLIRIFDVLGSGQLLQEVRRGTFSHQISDLQIDNNNTFMLVASISSTMHLFKLSVSDMLSEIIDSDDSVTLF